MSAEIAPSDYAIPAGQHAFRAVCAASPFLLPDPVVQSTHDDESLPAGTWISMRGVRRFIPADPVWRPQESAHHVETVLAKLAQEPPMVPVPEWRAHRHICECGCLLFGIENCPNCEWNALQNDAERTA